MLMCIFAWFHMFLCVFVCFVCSCVSDVHQAEAAVARNSLQAISVMAGEHVSGKMKGGEGLSVHLAAKPDLFVGVLRTLLHVSERFFLVSLFYVGTVPPLQKLFFFFVVESVEDNLLFSPP